MFLRACLFISLCIACAATAALPEVIHRFRPNRVTYHFVEGRDGALYGVIGGQAFRLTTAGDYRVIYNFDAEESPNLVAASDGHLYGTASFSGTPTLFRLSYSGRLESLYEFPPDPEGKPVIAGELLLGPDDTIYGIVHAGDTHATVFRATLDGDVAPLAVLTNPAYRYPGSMILGHDGALRLIAYTQLEGTFFGYDTIVRVGLDGTVDTVGRSTFSNSFAALWAHPDGNYYVKGYSSEIWRLSPSGELLPIGDAGSTGNFFARDGSFLRFSFPSTANAPIRLMRMQTDGIAKPIVWGLPSDISRSFVLQNHRGTFFGIQDAGAPVQKVFRWRLPDPIAVNLGPYARPDFVPPPAPNASRTIAVLRNDRDVDGDPLTITGVNPPRWGSASLAPNGKAIIYTAPAGEPVTADEFSYTIVDGQGGSALGRVSLRANLRGQFTALLPNPDWRYDGQISARLTGFGGVTGRVWMGGFPWRFGGILDDENRFTAVLRNDTFQTIELTIEVQSSRSGPSIEATIRRNDTTTEQVLTPPNLKRAASVRGVYTFIIPPERSWRDLPKMFSEVHSTKIDNPLQQAQGYGFGRWRVLPNGSVVVTGKMPDGAPFTATNWLDDSGRLQLFGTLYPYDWTNNSIRGWIRGFISFRDTPDISDADGPLKWAILVPGMGISHPPLEEEGVSLRASRYLPPAELGDFFSAPLEALAAGGGFPEPDTGTVNVIGNNLSAGPPFRINGKFDRSSGNLNGHLHRAGKWTNWHGILVQKQRSIFGRFQDFKPRDYWEPFSGSGLLKIAAP